MKLEKSMQLGELYRELRIARGLKLKDVARENLSVSQLSRFENGQSMLAADKLLIAISGIHMTFSEFGHAINNYQEPKAFQLSTKIAELYNNQDIEGLKVLLESENEVFDVYNRLNKLIIKVYMYNLDPTYAISEEEKNFLTSYLYEIEEWTEFELFIFGNTMSILSESDLIFLGKAFVDRDKLYQSLPSHKKNAEMVFLNLILALISYKKLYQANYFIEALEKILTYQDMFAITWLNFLKKIIVHLEKGTKDLSDLEKFIDCVETIGNPTMVAFLKANLNSIYKE
ncbi:MutR family transcriptional regulator [Streptococcus equinus JB1]|uniref:MutR family transcriptional regulator n=1 Tax=Streptococcus equinus JB1 TaxID=1294274 RepID=A0A091BXP8_STREI|nr:MULTISPECIES: Rgg/GadR/MutR family transcriptional regulator [Streptococcus]KFN88557.1 MutR family transcriptional regulator [Streptococcus equinus JB1]UOC11072.1 Rgg/GadR/MutR family transcriptional regulator [Streptococcus equinus]WFM81791.1 Rgg/GadR/MutR family transcriptional regulator [Streptococcus ruminicola]SFL28731.1 transcriptional activator, Rgg/GadR/MutR family, C-terminal domain-containing protein [Streptococcus equinus JB1]HHU65515.1 Rgg/GadR/MutR family transcriptional regula